MLEDLLLEGGTTRSTSRSEEASFAVRQIRNSPSTCRKEDWETNKRLSNRENSEHHTCTKRNFARMDLLFPVRAACLQ